MSKLAKFEVDMFLVLSSKWMSLLNNKQHFFCCSSKLIWSVGFYLVWGINHVALFGFEYKRKNVPFPCFNHTLSLTSTGMSSKSCLLRIIQISKQRRTSKNNLQAWPYLFLVFGSTATQKKYPNWRPRLLFKNTKECNKQ